MAWVDGPSRAGLRGAGITVWHGGVGFVRRTLCASPGPDVLPRWRRPSGTNAQGRSGVAGVFRFAVAQAETLEAARYRRRQDRLQRRRGRVVPAFGTHGAARGRSRQFHRLHGQPPTQAAGPAPPATAEGPSGLAHFHTGRRQRGRLAAVGDRVIARVDGRTSRRRLERVLHAILDRRRSRPDRSLPGEGRVEPGRDAGNRVSGSLHARGRAGKR